MISENRCRQIEYEILGCHLENLSTLQLDDLLGTPNVFSWRKTRASTEHIYTDSVNSVFHRTKDRFDWASVRNIASLKPHEIKAQISPEVEAMPVMEQLDFQGDPVDLRFMAFAEKVNKLILEQKSPVYKDSWRKRGLVGIYHNLCRKWDRIENTFEDDDLCGGRELHVDKLPTGDESIVETIADLFAYCGKTMAYFEYEPRYRVMLEQWKVRNGLEDGS